MRYSRIGSCLWLFFTLIFFSCTDEDLTPNYSFAKKDGVAWHAEPNAEYGLHFGDSSMIISLSVRTIDRNTTESIGFYYVPLITKKFSVIDSTLRDSTNIRATFVMLNGDLIQYQLSPSDDQENYLIIESYNPVTKELVMSFSVLFETRHPAGYPNWKHVFTEGKICTVLEE